MKDIAKPAEVSEGVESKIQPSQTTQSKVAEKTVADQIRPAKPETVARELSEHAPVGGPTAAPDSKPVAAQGVTQSSPPRPAEFVYQLAERIQSQLQSGQGEVRIQLKPEHLGNLEIKAENTSSGIIARIAAESSSVKQYLEGNIHVLQQSLQEQGLKVDRIDVVLQHGLDSRQTGTHQQNPNQTGNGHQGTNADSEGNAPRQSPSHLIEMMVDPSSDMLLGPNSTFHTVA